MKIQSVAILGAGAVGCYLLWGLADKAAANTLQLGVVAEGSRAERLRQNGCTINGQVYHPQVWTPQQAHGVDLLIVALKYGALPGALDSIRTIVSERTVVMSLMNGVDSEELIAAQVGAAHVLPALIRRLHEAKVEGKPSVTCWGDGSPLREFLYVDDLANLCVFLMNNYSGNETVNAGTGKELTIKELTELVAKVVGYSGKIEWDTSKPNGTPRKLLDVSKATNLGWTYKTELEEGIRLSYEDFLNNPMRAER